MKHAFSPWKGTKQIRLTKKAGDERRVMALLTSDNPQHRAYAIKLFNKMSQKFGDEMLRLSSTSLFPDSQLQGIPAAVSFGDADRQAVDLRWTALVTIQDRRGQRNPYFKITDTYNAVTFKAYQLGERIEMRHVLASQEIFEAEIFAGGLQWNRLWSMWQDLWNEGEGLTAMQTKYANTMASIVYQVLTASGVEVTAYDTTGANTLEKDINTLNKAAQELENEVYEALDPEDNQVEEELGASGFYLLYNSGAVGYEARIARALAARLDMPNDNLSVGNVLRNITPIGSRRVPVGAWYLVLPGRKLIAANFKDLQIFDINDPRVAGVAEGRVGQGAYKVVRGDSNQVRQVAIS